MILGKLRIIILIEVDLQYIMRIYLSDKSKELIELDKRFSKSNYRSRKNYLIKTAILEKWLTFDSSLLSNKLTIYHLADLQSCYDRQLANIGGILEESVRRNRKAMKLITKVIPNQMHYLSTVFGISENYYGGESNQLVGTG